MAELVTAAENLKLSPSALRTGAPFPPPPANRPSSPVPAKPTKASKPPSSPKPAERKPAATAGSLAPAAGTPKAATSRTADSDTSATARPAPPRPPPPAAPRPSVSDSSVAADSPQLSFTSALLEDVLNKMNRDGRFEKNNFVLTTEALIYSKPPSILSKPTDEEDVAYYPSGESRAAQGGINIHVGEKNGNIPPSRVIPLGELLALPLEAGDEPGRPEKYCRTFKVLSKEKSFFLRASSVERKDAWVKAISEAAREQQLKQGALRVLAEMAPIWQADQSMCQICSKQFTFFIRKHHCRNCGRCVCEICSRDKMRVPSLDERQLFKVCSDCGKELKKTRAYGVEARRSGENCPP